jgi:hypothetical protein
MRAVEDKDRIVKSDHMANASLMGMQKRHRALARYAVNPIRPSRNIRCLDADD